MSFTVAIRADASPAIGGGHVMRCLTLAAELSRRGAEVTFLVAPGTGESVPSLARSGHAAREVGPAAEETLAALRRFAGGRVDVLVTDSYAISAAEERVWRECAQTILAIDDLADRPHDCDILLDQTFGRDAANYAGLVPAHARVLVSSAYALLRPEFSEARSAALARRMQGGPVRRILISLGMTDVGGVTEAAVRAALAAAPCVALDVVLSRGAPSWPAVEALSRSHAGIAIHSDASPAEMCRLMAEADLAIGAAGSTSWERCCLGLPTVMVVLADNQRMIAGQLAEAGAAAVAEWDGGSASLSKGLRTLLSLPEGGLREMSARSGRITDGLGLARIADQVMSRVAGGHRADGRMRLRPATAEDATDLYAWRNDPATRQSSKSSAGVAWSDHVAWIERSLASPDRILLIAEDLEGKLGTVRFDRLSGLPSRHLVSITVNPARRGRGAGKRLLRAGIDEMATRKGAGTLDAEIHHANAASQAIFASCGFSRVGPCTEPGFDLYRRHGA